MEHPFVPNRLGLGPWWNLVAERFIALRTLVPPLKTIQSFQLRLKTIRDDIPSSDSFGMSGAQKQFADNPMSTAGHRSLTGITGISSCLSHLKHGGRNGVTLPSCSAESRGTEPEPFSLVV